MGALAWSFIDNWEFGQPSHFGIQGVHSGTQERFYKKSFFDLVDFVKARQQGGYAPLKTVTDSYEYPRRFIYSSLSLSKPKDSPSRIYLVL